MVPVDSARVGRTLDAADRSAPHVRRTTSTPRRSARRWTSLANEIVSRESGRYTIPPHSPHSVPRLPLLQSGLRACHADQAPALEWRSHGKRMRIGRLHAAHDVADRSHGPEPSRPSPTRDVQDAHSRRAADGDVDAWHVRGKRDARSEVQCRGVLQCERIRLVIGSDALQHLAVLIRNAT
jgi:hypothetical protein